MLTLTKGLDKGKARYACKIVEKSRWWFRTCTQNFVSLIAKDFQVVDVDVLGKCSWPVVFEGKCRIQVEW